MLEGYTEPALSETAEIVIQANLTTLDGTEEEKMAIDHTAVNEMQRQSAKQAREVIEKIFKQS